MLPQQLCLAPWASFCVQEIPKFLWNSSSWLIFLPKYLVIPVLRTRFSETCGMNMNMSEWGLFPAEIPVEKSSLTSLHCKSPRSHLVCWILSQRGFGAFSQLQWEIPCPPSFGLERPPVEGMLGWALCCFGIFYGFNFNLLPEASELIFFIIRREIYWGFF